MIGIFFYQKMPKMRLWKVLEWKPFAIKRLLLIDICAMESVSSTHSGISLLYLPKIHTIQLSLISVQLHAWFKPINSNRSERTVSNWKCINSFSGNYISHFWLTRRQPLDTNSLHRNESTNLSADIGVIEFMCRSWPNITAKMCVRMLTTCLFHKMNSLRPGHVYTIHASLI